jgi:hypothetical protein
MLGLWPCLARPGDDALLAHWKLSVDAKDYSGNANHGVPHGVRFEKSDRPNGPATAAHFDGRGAYIEIPSNESLQLGTSDFTLTLWAFTQRELDDVIGDLVCKFDPDARRGFNWCIKIGAGTTGSQSNFRNMHFGIDAETVPKWTDCGRPGNAVYIMAMAVHDGHLFVGTCEGGQNDKGHVYRYGGGTNWIDCGSPDGSNAVTALLVHHGKLYAGTGRYRLRGSALVDSLNQNVGGRVLRYEAPGKWVDCGQVEKIDAVGGLGVFRGQLFATSMYNHPAFYRYAGGRQWLPGPLPANGHLITALSPYNGFLYAASWGGCDVYRFDGDNWSDAINLEPNGQTYSLEVHAGGLYTGTWRNGRVYRTSDGVSWTSTGRLGDEQEVMGMAVHNGKLYAGTLPLARVFRFDDELGWTNTGQLDDTPEVRYRRAWSMAVFQGRLFCGTLPSGRVHALTAGCSVTHDHELKPGWRHLAAVRSGDRLQLYVDAKQVAESMPIGGETFDLANEEPLLIGFGGHDYFQGRMSELRLYGQALTPDQISSQFAESAR